MSEFPITQQLKRWQRGEHSALRRLLDGTYDILTRIGRNLIRKEYYCRHYQTSELIHDAYLRFSKIQNIEWRDRKHYFFVYSGIMQRILIDRSRARDTEKRAADYNAIAYDDTMLVETHDLCIDLLYESLEKLKVYDPHLRDIVEMRFYLGLSYDEIASELNVSRATVKRKWSLAQSWLSQNMQDRFNY